MHPAQAKYFQMAQQLFAITVQLNTAYDQEQSALQLHTILAAESLATHAGTQASLQRLGQLAELTSKHKEVFQQLITSATEQLLAVTHEMPADLAEEAVTGLSVRLNPTLAILAEQYADREAWIHAAQETCHLIEANRDDIEFAEGALLFHADEPMEQFDRLIERLDEIARREQERFAQRKTQVQEAMNRLAHALQGA